MATTPPAAELFLVEMRETVLVKPSAPSPAGLLSLSTVDNDPSLDLICQTVYVYPAGDDQDQITPGGDADGRPATREEAGNPRRRSSPASMIREGLSKALVHYYPLAGRLIRRQEDGKIRVACSGEGVPFAAAAAACTLADINHLDGVEVSAARQLVFRPAADAAAHPLMMQVTEFSCGGFTLGVGLSHAVCDGFGAMQFLKAVAELAAGPSEPSVAPVWERDRLAAAPAAEWQLPAAAWAEDDAALAASPLLPSDDLVHGHLDVDGASVGKLKASLQEAIRKERGGGEDCLFTGLEALGALIWRSRFRALQMNPEGTAHFVLAVGVRNIVEPPLPEGYYGNAFVGSHAFLRGGELSGGPLWKAAAAIRESKRRAQEPGYAGPYLGMLERMRREKRRPGGRGSSLLVTDWRHMGVAAAAFGGRPPANVLPLPWEMFSSVELCILMPRFVVVGSGGPAEGGVRVLVCLPRASMASFEEEMAASLLP